MTIESTHSSVPLTGFGEGERVPGDSSLLSTAEPSEGGRLREARRLAHPGGKPMSGSDDDRRKDSLPGLELKKLNLEQIRRIDSLLASLGDYGEIHLIVQHGELRYINKVESYRAWNDHDKKRDGE
jgi:hypothetical protein